MASCTVRTKNGVGIPLMPLFLWNGETKDYKSSDNVEGRELLELIYTKYESTSKEFTSLPVRSMEPPDNRVVYVNQRELAAKAPDSKPMYLGSEDATTCHILSLSHPPSKAHLLCHLDEADVEGNINLIETAFLRICPETDSLRLDLRIIGGFTGDRNCSEQLSINILQALQKSRLHLNLRLASVSKLNTLLEIYNSENEEIVIPPFHYQPIRYAREILELPNTFIRQNLSTSPLVEPPDFESSIRSAIQFTLENPESEGYFKGVPKKFRLNDANHWVPSESSR